jgi:hypothetical protein
VAYKKCETYLHFKRFRIFSIRELKKFGDNIYVTLMFGDFSWKTPLIEYPTIVKNFIRKKNK